MTQDIKSRILAEIRATHSPTRAESRAAAPLVVPSSVAIAAALFFGFGGVRHGEGRPGWFWLVSIAGWALVAALSVWGAFERGRSAVGPPRARLAAIAVGTPLVLLAMMFWLERMYPEVSVLHADRLGLRCLALTLAGAAFPLGAFAIMRRGSDPVHPVAAGAALGSACGASAGVMVEMWCPVAAPFHVVIGHVLPIVLTALVGAGLGSSVMAMRGRRDADARGASTQRR